MKDLVFRVVQTYPVGTLLGSIRCISQAEFFSPGSVNKSRFIKTASLFLIGGKIFTDANREKLTYSGSRPESFCLILFLTYN